MKKIFICFFMAALYCLSFSWAVLEDKADDRKFLAVAWVDSQMKMESFASIDVMPNFKRDKREYYLTVNFNQELLVERNGTTPFSIEIDGKEKKYNNIVSDDGGVIVKLSNSVLKEMARGSEISFITTSYFGEEIKLTKPLPNNLFELLDELRWGKYL